MIKYYKPQFILNNYEKEMLIGIKKIVEFGSYKLSYEIFEDGKITVNILLNDNIIETKNLELHKNANGIYFQYYRQKIYID